MLTAWVVLWWSSGGLLFFVRGLLFASARAILSVLGWLCCLCLLPLLLFPPLRPRPRLFSLSLLGFPGWAWWSSAVRLARFPGGFVSVPLVLPRLPLPLRALPPPVCLARVVFVSFAGSAAGFGFRFLVPALPPPFCSCAPGLSGLVASAFGFPCGLRLLLLLPSLRCGVFLPCLRCSGVSGLSGFPAPVRRPLLPSLRCVRFWVAFPPPGCACRLVALAALTGLCVGLWLVPPPCWSFPAPPLGSPVLGCVGLWLCARPPVFGRSRPVGWGC